VVPRRHWAETCADFSRRHRGWLVQLWAVPTAIADASGGDGTDALTAAGQPLATGVPLHDVELDARGAQPAIVLHTAAPPGSGEPMQQLRIANPAALSVERAADGTVIGLRIDDTAGHSTLLHFRTTEPPEMLDGLADTEL
jgi:hypothetical protein